MLSCTMLKETVKDRPKIGGTTEFYTCKCPSVHVYHTGDTLD